MKSKEIKSVIKTAIKTAKAEGTDPVRETILVTLLTAGAKASTAMAAITKAFKEAGIIATVSVSSLKECREYLASSMPDMETYRDMRKHAADMNAKFNINEEDEEKGVASAMKLIKEQLKEDSQPVPKKIHLGVTKSLMVEYFLDAYDNEEETSVEGLTEHLIDNVYAELSEDTVTDEMKKKLKITAGTDYNFAMMLVNGLRLEEVN